MRKSSLNYTEPRVLHLISSSGFLGAENVVLELAKESVKAGYWVTIGIIENRNNLHMELLDRSMEEGIKVHIFPCGGRFDWRTISSIRSFIDEEKPNILHSHGYKSNFYALTANKGKFSWVVTNHLWKKTTFALKVYAYLDSLLIRRADRVIAVSEEIVDEMQRRGILSQKILVIDNGVDIERFVLNRNEEMRKSFGFNGNSKVIGTIASLTPEKGHIYLLRAIRQVIEKCPECRFLIVGDGGQRQFLEEKSADLGLTGKVLFTGSRKDVPEILSMLDIFVLPSLKEGLPMALLEAMAAAVPVIATKVGAVLKVVMHGETGLLVEKGDVNGLGEAIAQILSDHKMSERLRMKGYEKVMSEFSSDIMTSKYLDIYRKLLRTQEYNG